MISANISSVLRSAKYEYGNDAQPTFKFLLGQSIFVLVEVEELLWDGFCGWLVFWVVIRLQVRVPQCLFNGDSLHGVESEKLL